MIAVQNEIQVNWHTNPKQSEALDLLGRPVCKVLLYGGAKGGGKSVFGCRWVYIESEELIEQFGLPITKNPICVGFMGRKQSVDFNTTTLETWKREIPQELYTLNEQKKEIVIRQRVKIRYGGMDSRKDIKKFNSAEFAFIFIDQAEEISEDEFGMLQGTLRLKINGVELDYKTLLSANPAACWIKRRIIKNAKREEDGIFFLKALPSDNPDLPSDYIKTLTNAFKHRPELLDAYLYGNWDLLEGEDLIIKDSWVQASHTRVHIEPTRRKIVTADVARFGDDRTIIYYMEDTEIIDHLEYGKKDTHYTSGMIAAMVNKHKDKETGEKPVIVLGGAPIDNGPADNLRAWGFDVIEMDAAAQADDPEMFVNLRAQMWWVVGQMYSDGDIINHFEDPELETELTVVKYKFRGSKIQVEEKEEIKKPERYGRSPDKGDAYIQGVYALRRVTPMISYTKKDDGWRKPKKKKSAMAV
jgi:hypothetical protein